MKRSFLVLAFLGLAGVASPSDEYVVPRLSVFHPFPGDLIRSDDQNHVTVDGAEGARVFVELVSRETGEEVGCPGAPMPNLPSRWISTCPPVPEGKYRIFISAVGTSGLTVDVTAKPDGKAWRHTHAKMDRLWLKRRNLGEKP